MITPRNILPVTSVKRNLMKLLKKVEGGGDPLVITREGKAAGILMSAEDYEGLMETLDILQDKSLMKSLKRSRQDFAKKRVYSHEQVFKE